MQLELIIPILMVFFIKRFLIFVFIISPNSMGLMEMKNIFRMNSFQRIITNSRDRKFYFKISIFIISFQFSICSTLLLNAVSLIIL